MRLSLQSIARRVALAAAMALATSAATAAEALLVLHDPRAVDGDTLAVDRPGAGVVLYVRLWGVAAPERSEPGGREATAALAGLVQGRLVMCEPMARPSWSRIVARCVADGADLGAELVRRGWARDCPKWSGGRYRPLEPAVRRPAPAPAYCRPRL